MKKILLVLFILALALNLPVYAKEYYLDKAFVTMRINPDASIDVTENITFDFRDSFTFAYRDFGKGSWRVSDIGVYENDQLLQFEISD